MCEKANNLDVNITEFRQDAPTQHRTERWENGDFFKVQ